MPVGPLAPLPPGGVPVGVGDGCCGGLTLGSGMDGVGVGEVFEEVADGSGVEVVPVAVVCASPVLGAASSPPQPNATRAANEHTNEPSKVE